MDKPLFKARDNGNGTWSIVSTKDSKVLAGMSELTKEEAEFLIEHGEEASKARSRESRKSSQSVKKNKK